MNEIKWYEGVCLRCDSGSVDKGDESESGEFAFRPEVEAALAEKDAKIERLLLANVAAITLLQDLCTKECVDTAKAVLWEASKK